MRKDSAPEKWAYRQHTEVKHILLEKYLQPWMKILGKRHPKICYVDGFAGRGEYTDGTLGSPVKALRVADAHGDYYDKMLFIFIEKDRDNFRNLEEVLERERPAIANSNKMDIRVQNREFAEVIEEASSDLKEGRILVPSFFFIDPFGFGGIPFETIKTILAIPRTEILFTFVTAYVRRFIKDPKLATTFTSLFGTDAWKGVIGLPDPEKRVIELYRAQLHEAAGAKYGWHFRVCETDRLRTLHHLVHATNNFTGHKIMKDIMFEQSAQGSFAYLGPQDVTLRYQARLFDIHDIEELKQLLLDRLAGRTLSYDEIEKEMCTPWYSEPPYIDTHYKQALKQLEKEDRVSVHRVTSKTDRGLRGEDRVTFPENNPTQTALAISVPQRKKSLRKHRTRYKEYRLLDGTKKTLVSGVHDGSIITRFDKTPPPKRKTDVVCPHFLELKWAYGCPFDCAWCYLKGTFRFRPEGTSPVVKPYEKTRLHVEEFLEEVKTPEILNAGEIADSLMNENAQRPFSEFIIPLFERQDLHQVLLLTKSSNVDNLLEIEPHNQVVISFSLNAVPVAERWEKAPHVLKRIEAAKRVSDAGYEVRVRIDPMVPIENWQEHYLQLLEIIFDNLTPERITLGSLRGLQSTINGCTDKTWVRYLKESSNWGKKIDFATRCAMYTALIRELRSVYGFESVALCKETVQVWDTLKMDYKRIRCNCMQ